MKNSINTNSIKKHLEANIILFNNLNNMFNDIYESKDLFITNKEEVLKYLNSKLEGIREEILIDEATLKD